MGVVQSTVWRRFSPAANRQVGRLSHQRLSHQGGRTRSRRDGGLVLITVLVVIGLIAISAASLLYRVNAEVIAASTTQGGEQAAAAAYSGLQRTITLLQQYRDDPDMWHDNPELFRDQLVMEDGNERWYYTVYSPPADENTLGEDSRLRFGVTDTSSRLNLNTVSEASLLALPDMTPELVDALLDYRDADDEPRPQGAEQEYYRELERPYWIKNGPFTTVEELLLVRGFTPGLLFGAEASTHRDDEKDGEGYTIGRTPLVRLLTTVSQEPDVDAQGVARVDLNGNISRLASLGLSQATLNFIRIYRAENNTFVHPSDLLGMEYTVRETVEEDGQGPRPGQQPGRGRGRRGGRRGGGGSDNPPRQAGQVIRCQPTDEDLVILMDRTTTRHAQRRQSLLGRVNVNTAPFEVLAAVEGMDADLADSIISIRSGLDPQARATLAWLWTEGVVDEATFRTIAPRLTTRSYQFHVRVLGYGLPSGRYRVYEAIVDLAGDRPRVVYLRDRTRLGLPMPIAGDGVSALN